MAKKVYNKISKVSSTKSVKKTSTKPKIKETQKKVAVKKPNIIPKLGLDSGNYALDTLILE